LLPTKFNLISGADRYSYAFFIIHKKSDWKILPKEKPYFSVIIISGTSLDSDKKNTWDKIDNVTERAYHVYVLSRVCFCAIPRMPGITFFFVLSRVCFFAQKEGVRLIFGGTKFYLAHYQVFFVIPVLRKHNPQNLRDPWSSCRYRFFPQITDFSPHMVKTSLMDLVQG